MRALLAAPASQEVEAALRDAQRKTLKAFVAADVAEDRAVAAGYPDSRLQEYG